MLRILTRRILILCAGVALVGGSLSLRLGNVAPDDIINEPMLGSVDSWHTVSEQELINQSATALVTDDIDGAKLYALQALEKNYTSGKAAYQLLEIYKKQGDIENGDKVAILASELWPAHSKTRAGLADYWLSRDNLSKLLPEWSNILTRKPVTYKTIFPALQTLANSEKTFFLLLPYMQKPPKWWPAFFNFLTTKNESLATIKAIYAIRSESDEGLTSSERASFVRRLIKERLYQDAHYAWMSGLDDNAFKLTGLVYDGGFEGQTYNTGFDWNISRAKGLKIRTNTTSGVTGARALQITLNHKRLNFRHLSQRLNLKRGDYRLSGRYRINRLKTTKGLSWRLYCIDADSGKSSKIAESERFSGRKPWSEFIVDFSITDEQCTSQLLRLEASSRYAHDHAFKGSLWFDDIKIRRRVNEARGQNNAQ